MKKLIWKILEMIDDNHGYSTSRQRRFEVGDKCKISSHKKTILNLILGKKLQLLKTGDMII